MQACMLVVAGWRVIAVIIQFLRSNVKLRWEVGGQVRLVALRAEWRTKLILRFQSHPFQSCRAVEP